MAAVGAIESVGVRENGRANGAKGASNGHSVAVNGTNGTSHRQAIASTALLAPVVPATTVAPAVTVAVPTSSMQTHALPMRTLTRTYEVQTEKHVQFLDITDQVVQCVTEAGVQNGFAVVFSRHTTAGIRINEHEPLLLEDLVTLLDKLVPQTSGYRHDDFSVRTVNLTENERVNGHSHCRSLLLGTSETVPVAAGSLMLGRWQRIFLAELDGPRTREFVVQVVGA